jgi:hypothetical protein
LPHDERSISPEHVEYQIQSPGAGNTSADRASSCRGTTLVLDLPAGGTENAGRGASAGNVSLGNVSLDPDRRGGLQLSLRVEGLFIMSTITIETLAEEMYQMVAEYAGKKNLKAGDLTKAMIAKHGEGACTKDDCKQAIRLLMDSGRCVYAYLGGSYIQLPPKDATPQA